MFRVRVSTPDWEVEAMMASGFADRLLGIFRAPPDVPVLLSTRSVHTFGLRRPITVVGIDSGMRVVGTRTVGPNRVVLMPRARFFLEMPSNTAGPAPAQLVGLDRV